MIVKFNDSIIADNISFSSAYLQDLKTIFVRCWKIYKPYTSINEYLYTNPMHNIIFKLTFIYLTFWPCKCSLSRSFIIYKLPFIFLIFIIYINTITMHNIILPLSIINVTISPFILTFSVHSILFPVSIIPRSIWLFILSFSMP